MISYPDTEELAGALAHVQELDGQDAIDGSFMAVMDSLEFIVTLSVTMGTDCDKLDLARSLRELSQVIEAQALREHQLRLS